MTIEFADPGFNWAFVWWPLAILAVGIAITVWLVNIDFPELTGLSLGLPIAVMLFVPTLAGITEYGSRVDDATEISITDEGFKNVEVSGDRFTAATSDGEYFSGYLIDLEPETGYAYRIVELED